MIDHVKLRVAIHNNNLKAINILVNGLWKDYIDYVLSHPKYFKTVFAHNLGSFDGIFLYRGLLKNLDIKDIGSIIDDKNNFISITYKPKSKGNTPPHLTSDIRITWKDSYRIFPVSLDDLCKTFGTIGKTEKYNPVFNDISVFSNKLLLDEFIKYSLQDAKALYEVFLKAQKYYLGNYKVDITTIFSTSTLSLKIFRTNFLNTNIPTMKRNEDSFIRESYFGGATDFYKKYGENLFYYDVNSLYSYVMLNPMPLNLIKKHDSMKNINFDKFFGFIECIVTAPKDMKIGILPVRDEGKTVFPLGTWKGTYFSEEIRECMKHGYKFKYVKGYEYSKYSLFNEYVNHFYDIKKNSTGSDRFIAKLNLNTLYGYFGRKLDLIETVNIHIDELERYSITRVIKNIMQIDENYVTLLLNSNINTKIMSVINQDIGLLEHKSNNFSFIKSNVAIASAVTAYARIHMIPFKLNGDVYYTDTDSIITATKLDNRYLGEEIGLMKDELDGLLIKEAYFLGIKQYGYWYLDRQGNRIEKSVFSGVERDSLSFKEIVELSQGKTINKSINNRFFRSFKDLEVRIKPSVINICIKSTKVLQDNNYLPLRISGNNLNKDNFFKTLLKRTINSFKTVLEK